MRARFALIRPAGKLAAAAPDWVVAMMARRAAVNEISRGWTGSPARRPLRAGAATAAASRAMARASSAEMTQAACSWAISGGVAERSIGPAEGPDSRIADLASFRVVSEPIHRQW